MSEAKIDIIDDRREVQSDPALRQHSFSYLQLISIDELVKLSGVSESSIRKACSGHGKGKVTVPQITRIGAQIRFRVDHVKQWLDSLCSLQEHTKFSSGPEIASSNTNSEQVRRPGRPRNVGGQK